MHRPEIITTELTALSNKLRATPKSAKVQAAEEIAGYLMLALTLNATTPVLKPSYAAALQQSMLSIQRELLNGKLNND
jgi:hypothetical protein